MNTKNNDNRVIILSPTESEITTRGKRHPNFAKYLSSHGWKVEYISSTFNHAAKDIFPNDLCKRIVTELPYNLTFIDIGGYRNNFSIQRILWNQRFAYNCYQHLLKRLCENDLLIVPSRPPELIYAAHKLKLKTGCRLVMDIRDVWPDALTDSSFLLKKGFGLYCDLFLRSSVNTFDAFVHVAPSFLPWLLRYAPEAQSFFTPLGFDENRWGANAPKRTRGSGEFIRLLHCGTLSFQLDIMPVLQAMTTRRERFHMTLIGDNGTGKRFNDVVRFIQDNRLESNVEILGILPPSSVVKLMPGFDLTIIPMISGALPNKVFDSIAACVPMLSLGNGDSSKLVIQNCLGWTAEFKANDVGTVLDAITNEGLAEKAKNISQCRSQYSQHHIFDNFERICTKLLATRR